MTAKTDLPIEEQVRQRAYQIWLERGIGKGSELDDWLQAEEEVKLQRESAQPKGRTASMAGQHA